ncbi:hypothetical protein FQN57_005646 [Myotisia sp. PD_48]|nr:hypothetical protein FQN57_005646 [Myotisia sp. PD_48]
MLAVTPLPHRQSSTTTYTYHLSRYEFTVPIRLKRAILQNDLLLVKRITDNYPKYLKNTDFNDQNNTSLHLAAILGFLEIIQLLVRAGHDSSDPDSSTALTSAPASGISLTTNSSTPLHLAAVNGHAECADFLAFQFPQTLNLPDKHGATPLMLAAQASNPSSLYFGTYTSLVPPKQRPRHNTPSSCSTAVDLLSSENTSTVTKLLKRGASVVPVDCEGNSVLHYASAWGNLKTFRLLVAAGAPPLARNNVMCTPADHALTLQAAAYCRTLALEFEKLKNGDHQLEEAILNLTINPDDFVQQQEQQKQQQQQQEEYIHSDGEEDVASEPISSSEDEREEEADGRRATDQITPGTGGVRLVDHEDAGEDYYYAFQTDSESSSSESESDDSLDQS